MYFKLEMRGKAQRVAARYKPQNSGVTVPKFM